ncbi:MAG: hypothetical protein ACQGTM_05955 [bacterium]
MKIALINGSPKFKGSASGVILDELKGYFDGDVITECLFHAAVLPTQSQLESFGQQDALVFAFPLYVDGIPSHLLRCLVEMEAFLKNRSSELMVYAVVNSGFCEGKQSKNALGMMKSWCEKTHVKWGQGVGLGGGGMLAAANIPSGHGPRKGPSLALRELAKNVTQKKSAENIFVSPSFPRFLYKAAAQMNWRAEIKRNGLKTQELFLRK